MENVTIEQTTSDSTTPYTSYTKEIPITSTETRSDSNAFRHTLKYIEDRELPHRFRHNHHY